MKIAEANLPLSPLLSGKPPQTQAMSWICTFGNLQNKTIGTILYKFRMRNKIDKAIEIENKKNDVFNKRYDGQERKSGITPILVDYTPKKIFEITIDKCIKLEKSDENTRGQMRPFFSYDFYKFEFRSATVLGDNPVFQSTKRYEVDANNELMEYMKKKTLRIDFIDESVDMEAFKHNDMADYIGAIRFPLAKLL